MDLVTGLFNAAALAASGYAVFRAERADRRSKALMQPWEWVPVVGSVYLLANRQPRRAFGVKVTSESPGRSATPSPASERMDLGPNEEWKFLTRHGMGAEDGPFILSWHRRPDLRDSAAVWRGYLPGP